MPTTLPYRVIGASVYEFARDFPLFQAMSDETAGIAASRQPVRESEFLPEIQVRADRSPSFQKDLTYSF
jgi:hypothetical protein